MASPDDEVVVYCAVLARPEMLEQDADPSDLRSENRRAARGC
jgi:hypothetical protein